MEPANTSEAAIFEAALDCGTPQERAAYLDKACAGQPELRRRIEELLAAHNQATGFLENPQADVARPTIRLNLPPEEQAGERIGRYKLLQKIGEGGCGAVYMAEQEEPVRRRVALKVIKLGMDTKQVVARFEAERQALALMDHPNIAKVLDAGATDKGRPFFVMELVKGIPITRYADENNLDTRQRLELFVQICQAVQHAHQKGIIHRDLKPSNILVADHDGVPVPKVIDFGIAKATTDQRLTDKTLFTALEQFIGTPAYMSPEQAKLSGLDVDTRSDIYSLGVLLYELLTGKTPFEGKRLLEAGLDEIRRIIREEEPPRPSTRLHTLDAAEQTDVAKHRHSEPPKLLGVIRGDLDWIVMKCLEKDRSRRYETANGLAADLRRHLNNEPVVACPPSTAYKIQKAFRRNKLVFTAGSAVAAALVLGLGAALIFAIKEHRAKVRADAAEQAQARMRTEAEIGRNYAEARLLLNGQEYAKAEQLVAKTPPRAEGAVLYQTFGVLHASHKEWQEAITNFTTEMEVEPSNQNAYLYLAPLLVQAGDLEGYHRLRGKILRQFAGETNPMIAERMTKGCLLLPPPASDLPAIQKLADTAAAAGPGHSLWPYFQFACGLNEYRQGRFESATNWLEKVAANTNVLQVPYLGAQVHLVLAMARHRLHQFWPARGALSYGCWWAEISQPKSESSGLGNYVNDWMATQILMAEARALIETPGQDETVVKAFDALVGRYDWGVVGVNVVTREGNHLFAQLFGQPKCEMFPQSETEFFSPDGIVGRLTFEKDNTGRAVKSVYRNGDFSLNAPRIREMVETTVDPAGYDALLGKYGLGQGQVMTVTRKEGRLYAQMTGGPVMQIFPKSGLRFFWKDVNAQVTFVKDTNGTVNRAVFFQSGHRSEATRIADVSPSGYDAFLGQYDYGPSGTMTVTRKENQLFAQITGQPALEILPASETEFFWKDVDARVTFVKNQAGKVTKAVHQQWGHSFDAPKIK
jgi:tRNA A-37 threonylcarbamoyl transferase component Bud32